MHTLIRLASFFCLAGMAKVAAADINCDRLELPQLTNYSNGVVPLRPIAPRVAIVSLFHPGLYDFFYTTNKQACNDAVHLKGYSPTGPVAYVDRSPQPGTTRFYGFWKGAPQTDHFYSSFPSDIAYVLDNGWEPLSAAEDMHLAPQHAAGAQPFYRAHFFDHSNAELAHAYSRSWPQIQSLLNIGWLYDTVAGYVYAEATPQPTLDSSGWTVPMGRRCEYLPNAIPGRCFATLPDGATSSYRDFQFNQLFLIENNVPPPQKTLQSMSFSFSHSRYFASSLHLAAALRANTTLNENNIRATNFHGLGLGIGNSDVASCGFNGPAIFVEAFFPGGNERRPQGCVSTGALAEGEQYLVTLQVDNVGNVGYTLRRASNNSLIASKQLNAAGWFPLSHPFPAKQGGFMLIDSGSRDSGDYDITISGFKTSWSGASGDNKQ